MSQGNKSAVIIRWPKALVRIIPPEAWPAAQLAQSMIDQAKAAERGRWRNEKKRLARQLEKQHTELRQRMLTAISSVCDLGRLPDESSETRRRKP